MTQSSRKFATAQERLRRIEKMIRPYGHATQEIDRLPRGEWIPGDYIGEDSARDRRRSRLSAKENSARHLK